MAIELAIKTRPHYLLKLESIVLKSESGEALTDVPSWVGNSLDKAAWVVVRRGEITHGLVPAGVRGSSREQRYAAYVPINTIACCMSPVQLRQQFLEMPPKMRTANGAFHMLEALATKWSATDLLWGPGGSAGFEIASRIPTVSESSDLDIVIYSDTQVSINKLRELQALIPNSPTKVDVQVETQSCGFSLAEYIRDFPAKVLLKKTSGATLSANPWA